MKNNLRVFASATVASIISLSALAQEVSVVKVIQPEHPFESASPTRHSERLNAATKASDILGKEVQNLQGEKLGKVEELAVDIETGRIVQVILASGGILGIGQTLHAVPPGVLHHDVAEKVVHLDASKEKFAAAPAFDMAKWAEVSEANHLAKTYQYYGVPAWFSHSGTSGISGRADGTRAVVVNTDRSWVKGSQQDVHGVKHSLTQIGHVQKASKIMGHSVINKLDEKLGNVENLMIDLESGRIVAVILSTGGFLGIGDELSVVPPTALKYDKEQEILRLDVSKESLTAAPHFKSGEWPNLAEPGYVGGVYHAYNVEPYFATDTTTVAESTRVIDPSDRALTPLDQGTSQNDMDTTTRIRREVAGTKELSVNAQNVKIITANGRVTLRGWVNSPEEKRLVGQIAINAARPNGVDNQLEVK